MATKNTQEHLNNASFRILEQVLADNAFDGGEIACFGDYAVSWNTRENLVAIADAGGWWTMPAEDLKAIAATTPNTASETRGSHAPHAY